MIDVLRRVWLGPADGTCQILNESAGCFLVDYGRISCKSLLEAKVSGFLASLSSRQRFNTAQSIRRGNSGEFTRMIDTQFRSELAK